MGKISLVVLIVGAVGCTGCTAAEGPASEPLRRPGGTSGSVVTVWDNVDPETGNLIAFWLKYPDNPEDYPEREKPVLVTEPYAVLMVWHEGEKRFFIYDNRMKKTLKTDDFDAFLDELAGLPRGIAIQRFDTCTVPRIYDMPRAEWQRLTEVLREGERKWAISKASGYDHETVCFCESIGFRFP